MVSALCAIQGFAMGLVLPSVISVLANWVPVKETSRLVGFVYSGKLIFSFLYFIAAYLI